eukprot:1158662-Pelagomonas_calceolata.AAC.5
MWSPSIDCCREFLTAYVGFVQRPARPGLPIPMHQRMRGAGILSLLLTAVLPHGAAQHFTFTHIYSFNSWLPGLLLYALP